MVKKTVGYVELEWTCKRCGTRNPGTQKTCSSCGAAMDAQDQFELPSQQELVTDEERLAQAGRGPDFHCPYCGARNPAGSETCTQCGGDLKDAQARQPGKVMGAFTSQPAAEVPCPFCGTPNPGDALRCKNCNGNLAKEPAAAGLPHALIAPDARPRSGNRRGLIVVGAVLALLLVCVAGFILLSARTRDVPAVVQSVFWERSIQVLEQRPVERQEWEADLPAGAQKGACTQKLRETVSEPVPGAEEVCGTPYTVDEGSGLARVEQDCEYNVYASWCSYTQLEWTVVDTMVSQGDDRNPAWPVISLGPDQREGDRDERFSVTFWSDSNDRTYTLSVSDPNLLNQYQPDSSWNLKVNTFGAVTEALPK